LLHARIRNLEEDAGRERVLRIHLPLGATAVLQEAGQTLGVSDGSAAGSWGVVD
jgi:hypothetical protein